MARKFSFWYQKVLKERRKAKEKALKEGYRPLTRSPFFTPAMQELHRRWKVDGDEQAKHEYLSAIAKRGVNKWKAGKLGGLATKLVKRKPYVKGTAHGNTGKAKPRKPKPIEPNWVVTEAEREASLKELQERAAYYLKHPGSFASLTWDPNWKPPQEPGHNAGPGSDMQRGVPPRGGTEDIRRDGEIHP